MQKTHVRIMALAGTALLVAAAVLGFGASFSAATPGASSAAYGNYSAPGDSYNEAPATPLPVAPVTAPTAATAAYDAPAATVAAYSDTAASAAYSTYSGAKTITGIDAAGLALLLAGLGTTMLGSSLVQWERKEE